VACCSVDIDLALELHYSIYVMAFLEILWTIGSIASIACLLVLIGDRRQRIIKYLVDNRRTILFYVYIAVASAFTSYNAVIFVLLPIFLKIFTIGLAALLALVFLSTIALWSPILFGHRLQHRWFKRVLIWVISALSFFVFVTYWVISWPDDLFRASLLTTAVVLLILIYFLDRYWDRVRAVFRCGIRYCNLVRDRLRRGNE